MRNFEEFVGWKKKKNSYRVFLSFVVDEMFVDKNHEIMISLNLTLTLQPLFMNEVQLPQG